MLGIPKIPNTKHTTDLKSHCDTKEDWENLVYMLRRPLGVCKIT
jgi:hypothetical protein